MRNSTISELRRLFEQSIPASSIAEPLASFDREAPTQATLEFMGSAGFDILGIRENGLTTALVRREELHEAQSIVAVMHPITPDLTIAEGGSLLEAVREVSERGYIFVSSLGQPTGIITRADLAKAPVRMWLFNLVTLLEMRMLLTIRECLPGDGWLPFVKAERVDSARELYDERQSRNEDIDLLDCLQFSDKKEVIVHCQSLRRLFGDSKQKVQHFLEDCERLRNDLAHVQDIPSDRWPGIVRLAEQIETLLETLDNTAGPHRA